MARFWQLFLASHLTSARLSKTKDSWILRYPWLASPRYIWRGGMWLVVVLALTQFSVAFTSPGCVWSQHVYYFNVVLLMTFFAIIAIMTFQLRHIKDGFFVVSELRMLGVMILITNLFLIIYVGDGTFDVNAQMFSLVNFFIQLIIQIWYPLWKSYQMEVAEFEPMSTIMSHFTTVSTAQNEMGSNYVVALRPDSRFIDILRHPDGFQAMKRFLTLEFSVENLLCWQQVNATLQKKDAETICNTFTSIYETFIRDGSPNQVNISSELKGSFHAAVTIEDQGPAMNLQATLPQKQYRLDSETETKLKLLERLHQELVKLMQMDSFRRFKLTKEFQQLFQTNIVVQAIQYKQ